MASVEKSEKFVYDSESGSDYEDVGFEPPKLYHKVAMPEPTVSADDKEVWLIKTPKNFPISALKTLPISFTASKVSNTGVKPFEVNKSKFQVNEDLFSSDAAKYAIMNKGFTSRTVDRFYTIREVVEVPEINYESVVEQRKDVEKIPNLRMRHFPSGYDAKDFPEAQPSIEAERVVKKPKLEAKQEAEVKEENTEKKEKKDKKDKEKKKKEKKDKKDKKEKKDKKTDN